MMPLIKHSRPHAARPVDERLTTRTVAIIATGKINCTRKRAAVGPTATVSPIRASVRPPMKKPGKDAADDLRSGWRPLGCSSPLDHGVLQKSCPRASTPPGGSAGDQG